MRPKLIILSYLSKSGYYPTIKKNARQMDTANGFTAKNTSQSIKVEKNITNIHHSFIHQHVQFATVQFLHFYFHKNYCKKN